LVLLALIKNDGFNSHAARNRRPPAFFRGAQESGISHLDAYFPGSSQDRGSMWLTTPINMIGNLTFYSMCELSLRRIGNAVQT
jgi:hypothetical protein